MATNSFGNLFRITTWGESHGIAIGVSIDGCPAGLEIAEEEIAAFLARRAPGNSPYTSPRKEEDKPEILSGIFEGKTTGAPISIMIRNKDADTSAYEEIKNVARPGHANVAYEQKYGIFDYRGGGRASARETACRVAAGAVAKKLLAFYNIEIETHLDVDQKLLDEAIEVGDSIGGIVGFKIIGLPAGLGEPVYQKFEAMLGFAMMSIPASKGFEIGEGFKVALMRGSAHNDLFGVESGKITPQTNHAGGTLGGITTGAPVFGRVAFKPTSSIKIPQETVDLQGNARTLTLSKKSRHDPCVAIRAAPVVEAMAALVVADALLMHRLSKLTCSS